MLLFTVSVSVSYSVLSPRYQHSRQHPVLKHPQSSSLGVRKQDKPTSYGLHPIMRMYGIGREKLLLYDLINGDVN
jgi:hypothetical protein